MLNSESSIQTSFCVCVGNDEFHTIGERSVILGAGQIDWLLSTRSKLPIMWKSCSWQWWNSYKLLVEKDSSSSFGWTQLSIQAKVAHKWKCGKLILKYVFINLPRVTLYGHFNENRVISRLASFTCQGSRYKTVSLVALHFLLAFWKWDTLVKFQPRIVTLYLFIIVMQLLYLVK